MTSFWVGLGGAAGSIARYWLGTWAQQTSGAAFPLGTLLVNVMGSFLISVVMTLADRSDWLTPTARIALAVGVLGGFTTYSSFNYETLRAFQQGEWGMGAMNLASTTVACLLAGVLGLAVGRALVGG